MPNHLNRAARIASAAAVAAALTFSVSASPASAAPGDNLNFYFDDFHIQEAHDAGFTGKGVTIAVLDSQADMDTPGLADADVTMHKKSYCYDHDGKRVNPVSAGEDSQHMTNIALFLAGNGAPVKGVPSQKGVAPDAKVLLYNVFTPIPNPDAGDENQSECLTKDGSKSETHVADAITDAVDDGADIISMSFSTLGSRIEYSAVAYAIQHDVIILGGLPNSLIAFDLGSFPADANGVIGVESVDSDANPNTTSIGGNVTENNSDMVDVAGPGLHMTGLMAGPSGLLDTVGPVSGTSYATPIVAGFISLAKQKYPDATTNQLLQSLIYNTNGGDHELYWDKFGGYGIASATAMLRNDPSAYEDKNPFIFDKKGFEPEMWEINGEEDPDAEVVDSSWEEKGEKEDAARQAKLSADITKLALIVGVPFVGAIIAGIVILIVVLRKRRKRSTLPGPSQLDASGYTEAPPGPQPDIQAGRSPSPWDSYVPPSKGPESWR